MKLFKDNTTGMMLISITDKKEYLLYFDGLPYIGNLDNVSEVDTNGSVPKFHRQHVAEEDFDINDDAEWHLKDVLYVPISGKTVKFRVEHISDNKIYFVAVDTVDESKMVDMNRFLDDYLESMPKTLVDRMTEIEHKVDGKIIRKSKLTLLSYANVAKNTENRKLDGSDDILFDGLLTEAERCKNRGKKSDSYWLDTPSRDYSNSSATINFDGAVNANGWITNIYAVVPCFALERKR